MSRYYVETLLMLVEFVIDQLYDSGRTAEFLEQVYFIDVVFGHRLWKTA